MSGSHLLETIATRRSVRAQAVVQSPEQFKICHGCQSIVSHSHVFCPFCRNYGFDFSRSAVVEKAMQLADRRLAVGCAVLPREITPAGLAQA